MHVIVRYMICITLILHAQQVGSGWKSSKEDAVLQALFTTGGLTITFQDGTGNGVC